MPDLVAARKTRSHDHGVRLELAQGREKSVFPHGPGYPVVLALVPERAGHAAAATVQDIDLAAGDPGQELHGRIGADQGFLVAVPVQRDVAGTRLKWSGVGGGGKPVDPQVPDGAAAGRRAAVVLGRL